MVVPWPIAELLADQPTDLRSISASSALRPRGRDLPASSACLWQISRHPRRW